MKIKNGFVKKDVAGMHIVVSADSSSDFDGIITLNDTGAFMFDLLVSGISEKELADRLVDEYEVEREIAEADTAAFIKKLDDAGLLEKE